MAVSNLVQAGATGQDIADKLAVSVNVVKAYVAKARTSPSELLVGMVVTNLLQTGASDDEIAIALAIDEDTVEGLIFNLPLRINGEEKDSSAGRSNRVPPPITKTPIPAAPTARTAVPQVAPVPAPTDENIKETPEPAPDLNSYSSDSISRRVLGILGIILSPIILLVHSHAMRRRRQSS
jgi:DNA-binding CsgD family transcriptional regulator|tara:strand:+ start:231 stop:770 length:540 start_codon:yes stop_codon:yes gene_type:complete